MPSYLPSYLQIAKSKWTLGSSITTVENNSSTASRVGIGNLLFASPNIFWWAENYQVYGSILHTLSTDQLGEEHLGFCWYFKREIPILWLTYDFLCHNLYCQLSALMIRSYSRNHKKGFKLVQPLGITSPYPVWVFAESISLSSWMLTHQALWKGIACY